MGNPTPTRVRAFTSYFGDYVSDKFGEFLRTLTARADTLSSYVSMFYVIVVGLFNVLSFFGLYKRTRHGVYLYLVIIALTILQKYEFLSYPPNFLRFFCMKCVPFPSLSGREDSRSCRFAVVEMSTFSAGDDAESKGMCNFAQQNPPPDVTFWLREALC